LGSWFWIWRPDFFPVNYSRWPTACMLFVHVLHS
jgi:hypothetical protein